MVDVFLRLKPRVEVVVVWMMFGSKLLSSFLVSAIYS